jgi:hypothetical protein
VSVLTKFRGGVIPLVAVVGVLTVAILLVPLGVQAMTTSVVITDPDHPAAKAHVVGGSLLVGDGQGPLTVDGVVGWFPTRGPSYFTKTVHMSFIITPNTFATIAGPFKSGTRFAITSVTFANDGTQSQPMQEAVGIVAASDKGICQTNSGIDGPVYAAVPYQGTVHLDYPQPLVTGTISTSSVCLVAEVAFGATGGWDSHVNVTGYVIA